MKSTILHPNTELPSYLYYEGAALADTLYAQIRRLNEARMLANSWFSYSPLGKFITKENVARYIYGMVERQEIQYLNVTEALAGGFIAFEIETNMVSVSGDYHEAPTYRSVVPVSVFENPTEENLLQWAAEERERQMNKIRKNLSVFDAVKEISYQAPPPVVKNKDSGDETDLE